MVTQKILSNSNHAPYAEEFWDLWDGLGEFVNKLGDSGVTVLFLVDEASCANRENGTQVQSLMRTAARQRGKKIRVILN